MGDQKDDSLKFKHFSNIRNLSGTSRYRRSKINPKKDLAFLVYSSGTTGYPKGVMLSHENIVANVLMITKGEAPHLKWNGGEGGKGDRILAFLPFYHIYVRSFSILSCKANEPQGSDVLNPPISLHGY